MLSPGILSFSGSVSAELLDYLPPPALLPPPLLLLPSRLRPAHQSWLWVQRDARRERLGLGEAARSCTARLFGAALEPL
jgi:hypothetical protein